MFKKFKKDNKWENVFLKDYGVHYSRIIASFANVGGDITSRKFIEWMESITDSDTGERLLSDGQIIDIYNLASNGKLEWEDDARKFLGGWD